MRRNSRKGVWSERQAEMFEDAYLNNDKRKDFFAISQRVSLNLLYLIIKLLVFNFLLSLFEQRQEKRLLRH